MATREELLDKVKASVNAQLKSPASAVYPDDLISISVDDINGYHISGFVDSQNSYGAMIRNDFSAEVSIINGIPAVKSASVGTAANKARQEEFASNYIVNLILTGIGGAILYFFIKFTVGM